MESYNLLQLTEDEMFDPVLELSLLDEEGYWEYAMDEIEGEGYE
jgi:hypothetical protein